MKFSKYISKAVTSVMALFQKQHRMPFKQGYDNLRSSRWETAANAGTAQSERVLHRNQSAVCTSHNVPSDMIPALTMLLLEVSGAFSKKSMEQYKKENVKGYIGTLIVIRFLEVVALIVYISTIYSAFWGK